MFRNDKRLCPVCGKTTFTEYASHDICCVCFWEDETWCEKSPDEESCANYCSLNEYRARYEKVKMKEFEKWNGFIEQLIHFECPADNEKARLRAELSLIEKQKNADFFQKIYDTWHSMKLYNIRAYLTGEAEQWFIFYFLDMVRESPIAIIIIYKMPTELYVDSKTISISLQKLLGFLIFTRIKISICFIILCFDFLIY